MKALGIVRSMDNLGRVVIPMEVRKNHGWMPGQPMELFMDGDALVIKAYGRDESKNETVSQLTLLLNSENEAVRNIAKSAIEFIERG